MSLKIVCRKSSKGNTFYALVLNDVMITFDVPKIARAVGWSIRDIYLLEEGEEFVLS